MFPLPNVAPAGSTAQAAGSSGSLPDFPAYQPGARYDSIPPGHIAFNGGSAVSVDLDPSALATGDVGLIAPFTLFRSVILDRIGIVGVSSAAGTVKVHVYNGNRSLFLDLGTFGIATSLGAVAEATISNVVFPKDNYFLLIRPSTTNNWQIQGYTTNSSAASYYYNMFPPQSHDTSVQKANCNLTNISGLPYANSAPQTLPAPTIAQTAPKFAIVNWRVAP